MVFSAVLRPILSFKSHAPLNFSIKSNFSQHCCLTHTQKHGFFVLPKVQKSRNHPLEINSVLSKLNSNINHGEDEVTDPAAASLKRLFTNIQKLEEKMIEDSIPMKDIESNTNLEILESDLQMALAALMKKDQDLQDAEKRILLDHAKLNRTKQDLEIQEREIISALSNQRKMEEDLKKANNDLASQSKQIEDLKFLVEEQEKKIATSRSALLQKEDDLDKLRNELLNKMKRLKS
ncbi:hypothetical protein J5N97_004937 [Dioscorea zingiberensis]|uniref:Uncharacterized protein n=1 Tax=Dioscorea zingiberensis TaxID=325984 RepID=A0A9D5HSA9_9LILI|nr:hypothetical protein J5N97_004937 [Dioscorea zingiberensis]